MRPGSDNDASQQSAEAGAVHYDRMEDGPSRGGVGAELEMGAVNTPGGRGSDLEQGPESDYAPGTQSRFREMLFFGNRFNWAEIYRILRYRYGFPKFEDFPRDPREIARIAGKEIKDNWKSGLSVALVNIPLSVSLAVASNAPPLMGVVTAIWSVLFGAVFAGSNYNIVGPTGALSGLLASFAIRFGTDVLPFLAIVAGLMSMAVWVFRFDRYFTVIPGSVIHGFTLGVAFIIGLNQTAYAFGIRLTAAERHEKFTDNMIEVFSHLDRAKAAAFITFLVFLVLLLLAFKKYPRIPWVVVVCTIGIIMGGMMKAGAFFMTLDSLETRYGDLTLSLVNVPTFQPAFYRVEVISAAASVCLIAVLETLISAKIADRMTDTKHNQAREVLGVAMANIGSGIFGGMPSTAALARTALNVKSGATSRVSTLLNALFVIIISFVLLPLFKYLLLPVIASVLVVVAIRMVETHHISMMWRYDRTAFWICMFTAGVCIIEDPTAGIVLGGAIALLLFAVNSSAGFGDIVVSSVDQSLFVRSVSEFDHMQQHIEGTDGLVPKAAEFSEYGSTVLVYRISGAVCYLNAEAHIERAQKVFQDYRTLIVSFENVNMIDLDGLEAMHDVLKRFERAGGTVLLVGIHAGVKKDLDPQDWYQHKVSAGAVFDSIPDALRYLDQTDLQQNARARSSSLVAYAHRLESEQRGGTALLQTPDGNMNGMGMGQDLGTQHRRSSLNILSPEAEAALQQMGAASDEL